jgi:MFS family permease
MSAHQTPETAAEPSAPPTAEPASPPAEPAAQPSSPPTGETPASSSPAPTLLRHPDFLKLWSAETISQLGSQVSALAIPFVALQILNATTFEIALLNVVEMLPFLVVGLAAGVWVDRLRRRPILIAGDLGRAILLATIPLAYLAGILTILQLYLVGAAVGVLTVFFDVAYQSYLPSLVERDQLQEGNAKLEISRAGAQVIGPGMAGVLIGIVRAPFAVALDALSFLGSGLFLWWIRRPEPPPGRHAPGGVPGPGFRAELTEGLHWVVGSRYLSRIAACTGTSNFFSSMAFAVLLVFAVRLMGMTAAGIGIAFSLGSLGALLGALTANRISGRIGVGPTIVVFAALGAPPLILLALAPVGTPPLVLVGLVALIGFMGGVSGVIYNVAQVSFRQAITPARLQGRMNATMRWIVWGTMPIGGIVGGILGTLVGVRETILLAGIGGSLAFLPVLFSPVRSIRAMPASVDDQAAAPGTAPNAQGGTPA